jgi:predicted HicB family RNase H-like nuclease
MRRLTQVIQHRAVGIVLVQRAGSGRGAQLEFIDPSVNYEGETVVEVRVAFQEAVEDYLNTCKALGVAPAKPYRGTFNVRIGRDLHRAAVVAAKQRDINLNELVKQAIAGELSL